MNQLATEARALCEGATPGPWHWDVFRKHKAVALESARYKVMGFDRYGMQGAQPTFRVDGIMERADTLAKSIPGMEHHDGFDDYVDHPDAAFIARSRTLLPEMAAEIERLEGIIESNRIPLLQYASLRKHFHALVHAVLGDDYYNMAMDTYTCDMLCCQDVAHECSKRAGKRFDKALAAMKEDEHG